MMKKIKPRFLLSITLLTALLISFSLASLVPNAYAAQPTAPEKSLAVLNDVAGFNMTAYTTSLNPDKQNQYLGSPQEEADFRLSSPRGSLRASCSFVNGNLHEIFISDYNGSP